MAENPVPEFQLKSTPDLKVEGAMPAKLRAAWEEAQRAKREEAELVKKLPAIKEDCEDCEDCDDNACAVQSPKQVKNSKPNNPKPKPNNPKPKPMQQEQYVINTRLKDLTDRLIRKSSVYTEIHLPSKGKFYDGADGPEDGILHIRPMTGEEELVLTNNKLVKQGKSVDVVFQRCLQENFKTDKFLSVDRMYLLIWLRGLSYDSEFEAEIKCPNCREKFNHAIDLDLDVNECPDDFNSDLSGVLPESGFKFEYKLSRGIDENLAEEHRKKHLKMHGDSGLDDTMHYSTAVLISDIEGITNTQDIVSLLKRLPIQDMAYLRGVIHDIPFGVETKIELSCPKCWSEFEIELPIDANFFFPRYKPKGK